MKTKKNYLLFSLFILLSLCNLSAQEKKSFLQHRFEGFIEIIHKNYTKEKLTTLKNDFARIGVAFNFSKLTFNKQHEITGISLKLKNKNSTASLSLTISTGVIPSIKIGETDGIVSISPIVTIPLKSKYIKN